MKRILLYTFALLAFVGCNLDGMQSLKGIDYDIPLHVQESEENMEKEPGCVRLVQYNVGIFYKSGANSMGMVVDMMKEIDADIISLNEVDRFAKRSGNIDQPKTFAQMMGDWNYRFTKTINHGSGGEYGIALTASPDYPIQAYHSSLLPHTASGEQRAIEVIEYKDFIIANTHLDLQEIRAAQAQFINSYITEKYGNGKTNKPIFLCGDMNEGPSKPAILEFKKMWTMVSQESGTVPVTNPNSCIDYVFLYNNGAKVEIVKTKVLRNFASGSVVTASDHLPVFIDFRLL